MAMNKSMQKQPSGFPLPAEPTIWALRKKGILESEETSVPSLYEHLFGYDPIQLVVKPETIRKGSAENPALNIINPQTNFTLVEIASDMKPEDKI